MRVFYTQFIFVLILLFSYTPVAASDLTPDSALKELFAVSGFTGLEYQRFAEGLILVAEDNGIDENGYESLLYGWLDETGEYAIEPTYKFATQFKDNRALVIDKSDSLNIIDRDNQIVAVLDKHVGQKLKDLRFQTMPVEYYTGNGFVGVLKPLLPPLDGNTISFLSEGFVVYNYEGEELYNYSVPSGYALTQLPLFEPFESSTAIKFELVGISGSTKTEEIKLKDIGIHIPEDVIQKTFQGKRVLESQGHSFIVVDDSGYHQLYSGSGELIDLGYEKVWLNFIGDGLLRFREFTNEAFTGYGIASTDGKIIVQPSFREITNFKDGVALAGTGNGSAGFSVWKLINEQGQSISNEDFYFHDVWTSENDEYFYCTQLHPSDRFIVMYYNGESGTEHLSSVQTEGSNGVNSPKVLIDGKEMVFDLPLLNKNNRTFYPMRELFDALKATVSWDAVTKTAGGTLWDNKVEFTANSNLFKVNGGTKVIDVTPFIQNGKMYIPIRFAAEGLGFSVDWDSLSNRVIVTSR